MTFNLQYRPAIESPYIFSRSTGCKLLPGLSARNVWNVQKTPHKLSESTPPYSSCDPFVIIIYMPKCSVVALHTPLNT